MPRLLSIALILSIWLLLPWSAGAQEVREMTVEESVRLGLEHSARLRAADAAADEARASYRQARSARLPSLSSQASYTRLSSNIAGVEFPLPGIDTTFTLVPVELNRYYSEISLEQPLFTGLRIHNQIRAAAHRADAAEFEASEQEAAVAFDIRQTYWTLHQSLALQDATEAALSYVDEHLKDVRNLYDVGAASMSDLLSAQTRRSEVLLEEVEADNAVRVAQLRLNQQLGLPLSTRIRPRAEVDVQPPAMDLEEAVATALERHPQISALAEQVESVEAQVAATRGAWFPELALSGRYVYARPNQYFFLEPNEFRGSWEATLALRWDLWNGGARVAETSEAQAQLRQIEAQLDLAREQLTVDVASRYLEVVRSTRAAEAAELNVQAAEESFRVARRQFEEGAALAAQVLDAEAAYRAALSRRARSLSEYEIARAALLNALGRVW